MEHCEDGEEGCCQKPEFRECDRECLVGKIGFNPFDKQKNEGGDVCAKFEDKPVVMKGCRACQKYFPGHVEECLGCGKECYMEHCKGGDVEACIQTDAFKQCDRECLAKKIPKPGQAHGDAG